MADQLARKRGKERIWRNNLSEEGRKMKREGEGGREREREGERERHDKITIVRMRVNDCTSER